MSDITRNEWYNEKWVIFTKEKIPLWDFFFIFLFIYVLLFTFSLCVINIQLFIVRVGSDVLDNL